MSARHEEIAALLSEPEIQSDQDKFDKARKLGKHIEKIRTIL